MRLHIGQVVAVVEAHTELSKKTKSSKATIHAPPVDNGLALYGSGLFFRLLVIDRSGKIKTKLLEQSVDAPSILKTIRRNYPYYSGSFKYATLVLRNLVPSMPPTSKQ